MEHVYRAHDRTPREVEKLVANELAHKCCRYPWIICNWHYGVWTPVGYVPQIDFSLLQRIAECPTLRKIYLVQITATPEHILERRLKDRQLRRRKLDLACVKEEVAATQWLYEEHHRICSRNVLTARVWIENENLERAVQGMSRLLTQNPW